jgi:hypothetical protein
MEDGVEREVVMGWGFDLHKYEEETPLHSWGFPLTFKTKEDIRN